MAPDTFFWQSLTELMKTNRMIIDRPQGSTHPHYPEMIYPVRNGYLENTSAGDDDEIDVWIGSSNNKMLTGILCTFDRLKRDAELKLLIGCTAEDIQIIRHFNNEMQMLFIPNPMVEDDLSN